MAERSANGSGMGSMLRRWWWPPVLLGLIVLAVVAATNAPEQRAVQASTDSPLFYVKRGPLNITVASSGNIRSADPVTIKNQVEGRTTILSIVEEGKTVEEGEVLMRLDTSALEDEELEEELDTQSSRASKINAEQQLQLAKKQGEADIRTAKVDLQLAQLDLRKYIGASPEQQDEVREIVDKIHSLTFDQHFGGTTSVDESLSKSAEEAAENVELNGGEGSSEDGPVNGGALAEDEDGQDPVDKYLDTMQGLLDQLSGEYKQTLQEQLNNISIAKAELSRARDTLDGSIALNEKGYITENELEADQLEYQRKRSELQLAIGSMRVLQRYTYNRRIAELENGVEQAEFQVEKAEHEREANVVDAQAHLHRWEERLMRDEQHLKEIRRQIEAATVKAPTAGRVVYGTSVGNDRRSDQEPLAEGVEVRERQTLFRLPKAGKMVADIKIHESRIEKIDEGLPVRITTDALSGKTFMGEVQKIAALPDSQSRWLNPDLKVYNTEIIVDAEGTKLRPGMSCNAEIIVREFEDTLYIPLQAVQQSNDGAVVYVAGRDGPQRRRVTLGMDDNRMVRIVDGLKEGEPVLLAPPLEDPDSANGDSKGEEVARSDSGGSGEGRSSNRSGSSGGGGNDGDRNAEGRSDGERGGPGNMSEEQRKQMQQRMENMSDAEKQKLRERMRQRRQSGSGGSGGGDRGGRPGE